MNEISAFLLTVIVQHWCFKAWPLGLVWCKVFWADNNNLPKDFGLLSLLGDDTGDTPILTFFLIIKFLNEI